VAAGPRRPEERQLRLLAYAAAKAAAGELPELLAAADVVEGAFRAEAEEKWGLPKGSSRRALRTLASLGYRPGEDRAVIDAVHALAREEGVAGFATSCPICGAAVALGGGFRHALEAHPDFVERLAAGAARLLGWDPVDAPSVLRFACGGGWWGSSKGMKRLSQLESLMLEQLSARLSRALGSTATVKAKRLAAEGLRRLPRRERNTLAAVAAAKLVLERSVEVVDAKGRKWRRERWDGQTALFALCGQALG